MSDRAGQANRPGHLFPCGKPKSALRGNAHMNWKYGSPCKPLFLPGI